MNSRDIELRENPLYFFCKGITNVYSNAGCSNRQNFTICKIEYEFLSATKYKYFIDDYS